MVYGDKYYHISVEFVPCQKIKMATCEDHKENSLTTEKVETNYLHNINNVELTLTLGKVPDVADWADFGRFCFTLSSIGKFSSVVS